MRSGAVKFAFALAISDDQDRPVIGKIDGCQELVNAGLQHGAAAPLDLYPASDIFGQQIACVVGRGIAKYHPYGRYFFGLHAAANLCPAGFCRNRPGR